MASAAQLQARPQKPCDGAAATSSAASPIDLVHLSRQSLGDRALELNLLALFERQACHIMEQLTGEGLSEAKRRDHVHTLKGSARAIGALAVATDAQTYEGICSADALNALSGSVDAARAAIAELLADR